MSDLEAVANLDSAPTTMPARPADVPEKFWNSEQGAVRVDALLKSYSELERKLGGPRAESAASVDETAAEATAAVEAEPPVSAGYAIVQPHPLIEPDAELDARLMGAGLSQAQAQLVYDLAAERLLPVIQDAVGEIEAQRQVDRLQQHFGGAETWSHTARQLKAWASANLAPEVHATLAGSYDGVLALHQMMRASEPELLGTAGAPAAELSQDALAEMMRDPRYWRQRDPEFIARVTAGFKRLYTD